MTMVKETHLVFELGDIVGVRLQCHHCETEIVQKLNKPRKVPSNCPSCGKPWTFENEDTNYQEQLERLRAKSQTVAGRVVLTLLDHAVDPKPDDDSDLSAKIRFELDGSAAEKS